MSVSVVVKNGFNPIAMNADATDDSFSEELFEAAKIALTHGLSFLRPFLQMAIRRACLLDHVYRLTYRSRMLNREHPEYPPDEPLHL